MVIFEASFKTISFKYHPYVRCTVSFIPYVGKYIGYPLSPKSPLYGEINMRTIFNIEIKTDIPAHDEARKQALVELFRRASRTLLTQTTMVSKGISPSISVTSKDNENGVLEYPLFEESDRDNY